MFRKGISKGLNFKKETIIPEGRSEMQEEMESKEMISRWINPNKHGLEKNNTNK